MSHPPCLSPLLSKTTQYILSGQSFTIDENYTIKEPAVLYSGQAQFNWDENKWIFPNSDIRHTLKNNIHITLFDAFIMNYTINTYIGTPKTPSKIVDTEPTVDSIGNPLYYSVTEKYNELRDWMPKFTGNMMFEYKWKDDKTESRIFLDMINIISFPNYAGPKDTTLGFEEQSWLDRNYIWNIVNSNLSTGLKIDIGHEIKF